MDLSGYDQFSITDQERNLQHQKVFPRGKRIRWLCLLCGILFMLLVFLLLLNGFKITRLSEEVAGLKHFLVSLNSSAAIADSEKELSGVDLLPRCHVHTAPEKRSCESLWLPFQSSCYLVSFKRVSWHEAENSCNQLGAHLMVVNDEDEQEFISSRGLYGHQWIGLVERGEEGNWTWVDGTNFNTTPHFWEKDQPDNWHEVENGEDCGQLHHGMYWNDADCSAPFSYICEKEAD